MHTELGSTSIGGITTNVSVKLRWNNMITKAIQLCPKQGWKIQGFIYHTCKYIFFQHTLVPACSWRSASACVGFEPSSSAEASAR